MSDKPLKVDDSASIAEMAIAVLRRCGPTKAKDIAKEIARHNGGHPVKLGALNRVLRGYLEDEVDCIEGGKWAIRPGRSEF